MEAVALFETPVFTYKTAQCHNSRAYDPKAFVSENMSLKVGPQCGRVDNHITDCDAEIYFA
jgi:hypothetical protein